MAISISKLLRFFFGVGVVLVPFNALPYFSGIFGEMSVEGAFYPFLVALLIWMVSLYLYKRKIYIPKDISFYLLLFFSFWIIISGISNLPDIIVAMTKGRTGIEKILLQYIMFIFTVIISILIYNLFRKDDTILLYLRRLCLISFLIAGGYSSIEIIFLSGNSMANDILSFLNVLIRNDGTESGLYYLGRLRSVCGEPSWLGMYLSFVMPWTLSYILTEEKKAPYILLNTYLIIMLILTMSRTAYLICGFQIILTSIFLGKEFLFKYKRYGFIGIILIIIFMQNLSGEKIDNMNIGDVFVSLMDSDHSPYNISNIARLGSQVAAINIFFNNPIFGVGLGQYGFYMPDFIPDWAFVSPEIKSWVSESPGTPWAPVHGLYVRILSELGIVGILIWLSLWGRILYKLIKNMMYMSCSDKVLAKILVISIIGVLLTGFSSDTFRFFGYWILMGVSWCYIDFYSRRIVNEKNIH